MKLVRTTATHEIWESHYEGNTVQFMKNIFTNELLVNAHHYALCIGYESLEQMMQDNDVLDACNEIKKETGVFPIMKQNF